MRTRLTATARTRVGGAYVHDEKSAIIVDLDDPERPLDHGGLPVEIGPHRVLLALAAGGDDAAARMLAALVRALRALAGRPVHEQLHAALASAREHAPPDAALAAILLEGTSTSVASLGGAHGYLIRDGRQWTLVPAPFAARFELRRGDRFALCSGPRAGELATDAMTAPSIDAACRHVLEHCAAGARQASALVAEVDGDALPPPPR